MQKDCYEQYKKWAIRLPHLGLRGWPLHILALPPVYNFILHYSIELRQQAAEAVRESAHWLVRLLVALQEDLVEFARHSKQTTLCCHTFAGLRLQNTLYANRSVIDTNVVSHCNSLSYTGRVRPP